MVHIRRTLRNLIIILLLTSSAYGQATATVTLQVNETKDKRFVTDSMIARWTNPLASAIVQSPVYRMVTDAQILAWSSKVNSTTSKIDAANINEDANNQLVTQAQIDTWTAASARLAAIKDSLFVSASEKKYWNTNTVINAGVNAQLVKNADSSITINMFFKPMTTAERDKLVNPPVGLIILNTDDQILNLKLAAKWVALWRDPLK